MPRTGTNKSQIGSLARFAYYLVDYLVGQIVIHMKHVIRGHIVLYDRYYFDFIHDAKRTNIVLPSWFMKMFYPLIYKPRLNFFLYAPSEVILARKQELDKGAIEELTQRYGSHFDSLSDRYNSDVYRKIKNTDRERTVQTILQDYQAVA
jgi:thymidylate kinase